MAQISFRFFLLSMFVLVQIATPSVMAKDSGRWLASVKGPSNVLFEAWFRVLADGQHAGYVYQTFEYDPKKRELQSAYYLRTDERAGNVIEALKARSTDSLKPLSYQYTSSVKGKTKTIDATFKDNRFLATIQDAGQKRIVDRTIEKGTFLSTFLIYVMLKNENGIKLGANYSYSAIAEEDAQVYRDGEAFVKDTQSILGRDAFRVVNRFNKVQFISFVTDRGEVMGTQSPFLGISTELVKTMAEATQGFTVDRRSLNFLFGRVAETTSIEMSNAASSGKQEQLQKEDGSAGPKGDKVDPGKGIHIKKGEEADEK